MQSLLSKALQAAAIVGILSISLWQMFMLWCRVIDRWMDKAHQALSDWADK